jgi:protein-S-isoprenylcysteine O-methyltransferase Ste14
MTGGWKRARRWLSGTSNRTFVLWPIVLLAMQALLDGGWPRLNLWALPLLAWGYGQYKLVGRLRTDRGGGGPGMSNPPERLVTDGPYRFVRNPMYLGHLIFFLGLALLLLSWPAWLVFAAHLFWFDRRARSDEEHLLALFGPPYAEYRSRVKRWLPGVY